MKAAELKKIAETNYSAQISISNSDDHHALSEERHISGNNLEKFKEDLESAFDELQEISKRYESLSDHSDNSEEDTDDEESSEHSSSESSEDDLNFSDTNNFASQHGKLAMEETEFGNEASPAINPSHVQKFALYSKLKNLQSSIEDKLFDMKKVLDKLANQSTNIKEENMSVSKGRFNKEAYYQGGGDVNEPTPGKPKYEKDPLNEKLRMEDKHMVGQKPFPDVGDVAGMHPSPESVSETNELERKKMLARAEAEERAIRRAAAVRAAKAALETQAYYQNGLDKNNANTPTPGQVKYKPDPLNEKDRELDKQMVGDKPFPDVGKVDDLYPGDRELKEKMSRASLKAKFVKAANLNGLVNLGESGWQVYHGDRLILTASVNDITGGRADSLYDTIATKEFGTKLLEKVKAFGPDRVSAMYKSAAEPAMPAAPGGMPAMPAAPGGMPDLAAPPPAPGGALPAGASTEDKGGEGDPKERAANLAQQAVDITSDLKDAVQALTGEREDMSLAGLTGGEAMPPAAPEASSGQVTTASLNVMRKELNYALKEAMLESIADLQDHVGELRMIAGMYDNGSMTGNNAEEIEAVVSEAFDDAKTAIANSYKLMGAFVKYARGTEALVKRASLEASDHNSAWSSDDGAAETSGEDVESMLHGHSHRPSDEEVLDLAE